MARGVEGTFLLVYDGIETGYRSARITLLTLFEIVDDEWMWVVLIDSATVRSTCLSMCTIGKLGHNTYSDSDPWIHFNVTARGESGGRFNTSLIFMDQSMKLSCNCCETS